MQSVYMSHVEQEHEYPYIAWPNGVYRREFGLGLGGLMYTVVAEEGAPDTDW